MGTSVVKCEQAQRKPPVFTSTLTVAPEPFAGNFEKFLVDRKGQVVGRWASLTKPVSPESPCLHHRDGMFDVHRQATG